MNNSLAPIILFVYNRPWHTEQTLEALMKNELADQSILYVYSDGAKKNATKEDLKNINEVRAVICKKKWCKEVVIIKRDENLGLANSVIRGITEVLEKYERVIVLEDDIVTGKYFLEFMNEGLIKYVNEKRVYGISGYTFSSSRKIKEKTFFLPVMSSWGYGTWKNRWEKINFDGVNLLNEISSKGISDELNFPGIDYYQMLKDQVSGKNDSWAVRFYISMFLEGGLFLYPKYSLIQNIGLDGSGVHCKMDQSQMPRVLNNSRIPVSKKKVFLKLKTLKAFNSTETSQINSLSKQIKIKLRKLIAPEIIKLIKRKSKSSKNETQELLILPRYIKSTANVLGQQLIIPDNASFRFMYKEIFEEEIYKFNTLNPEPYIIDGGANIGLATIYFKQLFPSAKILAFEPDPDIFKILKNNIQVFKFNNIQLIQKGLWNCNTRLNFWSEGADAGLITDLDKSRSSPLEIETTSLKEYLDQRVDFLKLDIEGAETLVLKDIEKDLDKVDRIFVEYHSFVGQPQTLNDIINILTKANFRLHISSPGLTSSTPFAHLNVYNNMDMQLNIYGVKEELI